ncbi:ribonuclease P protein component [Parafilimonas sp.]|uniref:ribonuclease P protein component n=1 Tax=Parafilimonas sp. TaxID=1969739 RepID=UPI0039E60EA0
MAKIFSYNKHEKLKSKKQIDNLFKKGKSFTVFPLKVFFVFADDTQDDAIKTGVGVSSRHFKKAVHRNRVKRLLREAYRTEKLPLHETLGNNEKKLAVFLLFIDKTLPEYSLLKEKMHACIQRLIHEVDIKNT